MRKIPCPLTPQGVIAIGLSAIAVSAARADYPTTVLADGPKAYYRFNDSTARNPINVNSGSLGAAGNASNDLANVFFGTVHSFPGAIVGDSDRSEFFDFTTRTEIPFNPAVNPPANQPFTVEAWLYPSSDQVGTGMGALCNRYTQGPGGRQGWVMYQRAPDTNHCVSCGPGVGWEFRMYNGQDGSGHLDVTSGVPFTLGQWQHVVVVYNPVTNDQTNGVVNIYINGVFAAQNVNPTSGGIPGYEACTGDHDPSSAVNGQPAMSLGGYNNANGGTDGFENPWFGAIDEYAWYPTNLTDAQILAHYQNGTNASRTVPYATLVQSDSPVVYLRLDELAPTADVANNIGDLRSAGIGVNTSGVKHPVNSPLAGETFDGAAAYHQRNGSTTTDVPFAAENNPGAGTPFTMEVWLRPTSDRISPGAAPINNRYVKSGNRTGWVIFQRAPDASYSGYTPDYEGTGWTFRMYSGSGSGGQDVTTGVDWVPGQWQHMVVTWEPQSDDGLVVDADPTSGFPGNDQWQGVLSVYINGVLAGQNPNALYAANVSPTEDGTDPADWAVGSYNAASGLGNNPYEGDVDEVAFYNNVVLTTNQIAAHYQAGTSGNFGAAYETLVFTAGAPSVAANSPDGSITERVSLPTLYLRFNDAPLYGAANSGTLGHSADGSLVIASNTAAGPQGAGYLGFEAGNQAVVLDGSSEFVTLNNPAGLEISGQVTLEAWIQPSLTQGDPARIVSHGPETITSYPGPTFPNGSTAQMYGPFINAITNTSEVFLRIDNGGANYSVGVAQYANTNGVTTVDGATATIPFGDLGGAAWVHLVGTYDGSNWNLYRNGVLLASQASAIGSLPVIDANWAVGATGEGWADNYSGGVDEVAIYDKALTPSQVASHFVAGAAGTANLTIVPAGAGKVTITWPAGTTLQSSTTVAGGYAPVTGATSPLTLTAAGTTFYRWSLQ